MRFSAPTRPTISSQADPSGASELIWDQQQNGGSSREVLHVIVNGRGQPGVLTRVTVGAGPEPRLPIGPGSAHSAQGVVVGVGKRLIELVHPEHGDLVVGPGVGAHGDGHLVAQGAGVFGQVLVLSDAVLGVA